MPQYALSKAARGSQKIPSDYTLPWVKLSGPEFNDIDPKYRRDLKPLGFLIGDNAISPEGARVIILGMLSGYDEQDRVIVNGREEKRRFAIWKYATGSDAESKARAAAKEPIAAAGLPDGSTKFLCSPPTGRRS